MEPGHEFATAGASGLAGLAVARPLEGSRSAAGHSMAEGVAALLSILSVRLPDLVASLVSLVEPDVLAQSSAGQTGMVEKAVMRLTYQLARRLEYQRVRPGVAWGQLEVQVPDDTSGNQAEVSKETGGNQAEHAGLDHGD